ncbi:uncharacterized protein LOC131144496 [Malania oleifera]|uniref:uncharacterized protein LOC131144496 n=1 Tax=Malania oleifera TaxID=397392 RepID=UPI0025AEC8BC|nr:uncharacterized protein LOC131144496 [Malania oleifera]
MEGHYANRCSKWYDRHGHAPKAQLAAALTSLGSISGYEASYWYLDTKASAHMTPAQSNLDQSTSYTDCQMGRAVATGKGDGGLYVLECSNSAFVFVLQNISLHVSYDLWHACLGHANLGHANHSVVSLLNKKR